MNTENLSTLKIHKLTKEQYERELAAGRIDVNAFYLTPEEAVKLSDLGVTATAAELNYVDGVTSNVQTQIDSKVDKIDGKGLSTNDYTTTEKNKLDGIEENATNTVDLTAVKVQNTEHTYTKDVPEDSLPYAEVTEIGGMTRKCTNLFDSNNYFVNICDGTKNNDGTYTVTASKMSENSYKFEAEENTQYTFRLEVTNVTTNKVTYIQFNYTDGTRDGYEVYINKTGVFTKISAQNKTVQSLRFMYNDQNAFTIKDAMLNSGSEPLPYEPYFEGLRSAPVTEVESVGVNLIPFPFREGNKTQAGVTFTVNEDGGVTVNGTPTGYSALAIVEKLNISHLNQFIISLEGTVSNIVVDGTIRDAGDNSLGNITSDNCYTLTDYPTAEYVNVSIKRKSDNVPCSGTIYVMLNKGSEPLPYTPYFRNTLTIPEAVQNLDGYGWGVNDEYYNYIDRKNRKFVRRVVRKVFDGTESLKTGGTSGTNTFYFAINIGPTGSAVVNTLLCNKYDQVPIAGTTTIVGCNVFDSSSGYARIGVRPVGVESMSTADFKTMLTDWYNAGSPLEVYYVLKEPEIIDISDILPPDNIIGVESGGTITMVNEYGYDVPSTVNFYEGDGSDEIIGAKEIIGDLIGTAERASRLESDAGSSIKPVYFKDGKPVEIDYTISKSVPSDAKFTDTTYSAAGSSLGLVKSGGDVTISSGVITVNDDSHNHVISNVDGLQAALDSKSGTGHTHTSASLGQGGAWCSTAASTTAKTASITGYTLTKDSIVVIGFTYDVAANSTLNISDTGAKAIKHRAENIQGGVIKGGDTVTFLYNGSVYHVLSIDRGDATTSIGGYMSSTDKSKLDGIASGANKTTVDSSLSTSSTNPVQNKIIKTALDALSDDVAKMIPLDNSNSTTLASGDDLDNLKTVGVYLATDAVGNTLLNSPYKGGQKIIVISGYGGSRWHQILFTRATNAIYHRMYTSSLWTEWANLSKTTLSDLGITATAAELNKMDGVTATTTELNCVSGVTSNIQTQLNGKADSSHGTHVTWSTTTPKANGTAAVGSETKVARGDHVHPLQTTVSGNAGSATKLQTAVTVDGVSFDGSANITHYGTCSTAAATAAKTVSLTGFTLATGATVTIKFTKTNSASNPTLNVNSTGAKAIYYKGSAISASYLKANHVYTFVYNGTEWDMVGFVDTDSDTKTSSTNTSNKIFLIGATSQSSSGLTTYSHDTAYVDTDGCVYSNGKKTLTVGATMDNIEGGTQTWVFNCGTSTTVL